MNETPQQFPEFLIRAAGCVLILFVVLGVIVKWMPRPVREREIHGASDRQDHAERLTYLM